MAYRITLFLLFILPLVVLPFGSSPFEIPKVITAEIAIELLLLLFLFGKVQLTWKGAPKPFLYSLIALFLLSLLYLLFFRTSTSLFGNVYRLQGIFLFWHLLFFSFLSSQLFFFRPTKYARICLILLALSSICITGNAGGRAVGTLGEPNALAATILFLLPFCLVSGQHKRNIFLLLLATTTVLISASRSGVIGLLLILLFLFLQKYISLWKTFSLCAFVLLCSLLFPFTDTKSVYENRSDIWRTAFSASMEKPILGWGMGNTQEALHKTAEKENNKLRHQTVDSAHNLFLDWFLQTGVLGLILFTFVLFRATQGLILSRKIHTLASLLGISTVMLFNPVSVVTLIALWWIVGRGFTSSLE